MKNEKRLIDANALIAEYDRVHIGPPGGARKLMEEAPAIDAVEVVRCKDCKHFGGVVFAYTCRLHSMSNTRIQMNENDFCSYGERKDNESRCYTLP